MIRILIAEDDRSISDLIARHLRGAGYLCDIAGDGKIACEYIDQNTYDLALLDIMMPGVDGYEVLDYLRATEVPAIFISAKTAVEERVYGLKQGAEDYISKPFELVELQARVETVLRRYNKMQTDYQLDDLVINLNSRTVKRDGAEIRLTKKEFDLLVLFLQNKNISLYRDTIYERVWGSTYMGESRTVDLHVQRLRKKLGLAKRLHSVYKIGYRLEWDD